jgi:hypothetical protein
MIKKRLLTFKGDFVMGGMWEKDEVVRLLRSQPGTQYQEADDQIKEQIRSWVRGLLTNTAVTVTFTKADGTDRDMKCTLNWDLIPPATQKTVTGRVDGLVTEARKERKTPKEPDPAVIKVFDVEAQAWRSFRMDRLKKITAELVFE